MFFISLFAFIFSVGALCGIIGFMRGQDLMHKDVFGSTK